MNRLTQEDLRDVGAQQGPWDDSDASEPGAGNWPTGVAGSQAKMINLVRAIEAEIIPRLMLAHRTEPCNPVLPAQSGKSGALTEEVAEFSRLVLAHDVTVAYSYVEALRSQGLSLETLYLDVLAPTARRLGQLWEEDLCDYTTVALGLWRLQQVLRELSPAFAGDVECGSCGRKALLASAPGEQHMLGVFMVSEFFRCIVSEIFRREGWDVWGVPPATRDELIETVHGEWFDLVELSVSCEGRLDVLAEDIQAIRRASQNRAVVIMVGGPVFDDHPELAAVVGADAGAPSKRDVPSEAEKLLEKRARACAA